ncbi:MAG: hypothetical protein A3F09_03460 [Chlamydiae bacterium RIFCSPHIGHO2_12_FULL_49_11]|nr:MAG: hypothetical protein A3F09_03460 [Chlamydiae bacterium RIFCSPHIGHO2_12_FULL_49_11]
MKLVRFSTSDSLGALFTKLDDLLDALKIPYAHNGTIRLILEEVIMNIYSYAYPQDESGHFTLQCAVKKDRFIAIFRDWGIEFNLLHNPVRHKPADLDSTPYGGLGIEMIRTLADDLLYERDSDTNILRIEKHFN